ncbi:MAG TPA: ABC-type transport auxiliary lipoprotein family protein [Caulobacterales bacterium]|nr:ABC-type transport auxiliary lipoprotein family protein [Caulobacterales bacterium]
MRLTFALVSALALSGCVSLLPKPGPAPRMFVLEAGQTQRAEGAQLPVVIAISAPQGERALLGTDLVWRTGDQLAFVGQTQWAARSQDALQTMLVQTIARQGRVVAAVRAGEARADYEVRWDLLDFEIDDASMQARFSANVTLVNALSRRVIASQQIDAQAPVSSRSSSVAAESLTRAAREGGARIGAFAVDAIARDQASAASISR